METTINTIPEPYASVIKGRGAAKCLSVQQPWATIIAKGAKDIEMRTWATEYRGSLVICSGKTPRDNGPSDYRYERNKSVIQHGPTIWSAPRGVAIALVDLYECREVKPQEYRRAMSEFYPGDKYIGWFVRVIQELPPVLIKGSLGLFEIGLEHELFAACRLQE